MVRFARGSVLVLAAAAAALLAAVRAGRISLYPGVIAAAAGAAGAFAIAACVTAVLRAARTRARRASRVAEAILFGGVALIVAAGLASWALGIQGFVILREGESVRLDGARILQNVQAGPLGDLRWMSGTLEAVQVRLVPEGDGFAAESLLRLVSAAGVEDVAVRSGHGATARGLVYQQGAFGFSPRIVVEKGGRTALDETVMFTSRRAGPRGVGFERRIELPRDGIVLDAAIDLGGLDERMKGHPQLSVEVRRGDEVLGAGTLLPGHSAMIREGWTIGFAGVKMWSEIDIGRRASRLPALAGFALMLAGAIAWPIAAWRRR